MIKRIWITVLVIGMFPMVMLLPIWGLVWVVSGKFILADYMYYSIDLLEGHD